MSIFSFVLIGLIIVFCVNHRRIYIKNLFIRITSLTVTFELMISIGYFLKIGDFDIGFSEILIIVDTLVCLYWIYNKEKNDKKIYLWGIVLLLACIISLFLQIIHPYVGIVVPSSADWDLYYFYGKKPGNIVISENQLKEILHVFCYIVIISQYITLNKVEKKSIMKYIFRYCKPFIWFGILEVFFIKVIKLENSLSKLEKLIFGNKYINSGSLSSMGISDRLKGLKSEPSMYGYILFVFFLLSIILFLQEKNKEYRNYAMISLVLMLLSKSFTAVICCVALIVYWIILEYRKSTSTVKFLIILVSISLIFICVVLGHYIYIHEFSNYYLRRFHLALINLNDLNINGWKGDYASYDGSTKIRMISIVGTLKYFISRPLFGIALGSTYAHSSMATFIAGVGIVGTIAWYCFTFLTNRDKNKIYIVATVIWCLLLIVLDNGLFPLYGAENIIILYVFSYLCEKKNNCYIQ